MGHAPQIIYQVLTKADDADRAAAVETGKPKEAVARARCWKGSLLKGLKRTGEPLIRFSCNCANPNVTVSSAFTKSSRPEGPKASPKGRQLEVGPRRGPRLLVCS